MLNMNRPYDLSAAHDVDLRPNASHLRVVPYPSPVADEHIASFANRTAGVGVLLLSLPDLIQGNSVVPQLSWGLGVCERMQSATAMPASTSLRSFNTLSPFSIIIPKVSVEVLLVDFLAIWWRLTDYDKEQLRKTNPPVVFGDPGRPLMACSSTSEYGSFNIAMLTPGARLSITLSPGTLLVLDNRRMLIGFPQGVPVDHLDVFNFKVKEGRAE
jgi:hypothetical protein